VPLWFHHLWLYAMYFRKGFLPTGSCIDDNNPEFIELLLIIDSVIEETLAEDLRRREGAAPDRARILGRRR